VKPVRRRRPIAPISFLVRDYTMVDPRDISEFQLRQMYLEYLAGIGRPVPVVSHRQGRTGHSMIVYGEYEGDE
jgi:hypothetical protein